MDVYLGRNKIVSITEQEGESDLDKLKEQFCIVFADDPTISVTEAVAFQGYNPEWEEYIELEMGASVTDKDKLKVVQLPTLIPSDTVSAWTT